MVFGEKVYVIARWDDPNCNVITLQDFIVAGQASIPIFSDEDRFVAETRGSGFEHEGVAIDRNFLASILTGSECLVLNPGSTNRFMTKADLVAGRMGDV